jgi:hypothetical protein
MQTMKAKWGEYLFFNVILLGNFRINVQLFLK